MPTEAELRSLGEALARSSLPDSDKAAILNDFNAGFISIDEAFGRIETDLQAMLETANEGQFGAVGPAPAIGAGGLPLTPSVDQSPEEQTFRALAGGSIIGGGSEHDNADPISDNAGERIGFDDRGNVISQDLVSGKYFSNGIEQALSSSSFRASLQQAEANGSSGSSGGGGGGGLSGNVSAQIGSNEKTFFAGLAQDAQQFAEDIQLKANTLEASIRQANQQYGISLEQLQIDKDRLAVQEVQGRRDHAVNLTSLVANQENTVNDQKISLTQLSTQVKQLNAEREAKFQEFRASLETQIGQFNATATQRAGEFNASQELQVGLENARNELTATLATANQAFSAAQASADRAINLAIATDQALSKNIDQQIAIAAQIADFTRDPGDIVANIAALDQFGSISQAISSGFSAITEESLQPLATGLNAQDAAQTEQGRLQERAASLDSAIESALDPNLGVQDINAPTIEAPTPVEAQQVGTPDLTAPGAVDDDFSALMDSLGGTDVLGLFNDILGSTAPTAPAPTGVFNDILAPSAPSQEFNDSSARTGTTVNTNGISQEDQDRFFQGFQFEDGGIAPPGSPVVVGDGTGETRELAMTDAQGNLVVIPFDQLPHAATGGVFNRLTGEGTRSAEAIAADRRSSEMFNTTFNIDGADRVGGISPTITPGGGVPNRQLQPVRGTPIPTPFVGQTPFGSGGNSFEGDPQPAPAPLFNSLLGSENPMLAIAQQQSGQSPLTDTTAARKLLQDAFKKASERFRLAAPSIPVGPSGIPSPLQVSAPGTSRFLQDAAAGLAQSGLGIKKDVFNEALARATPRGVQAGTARRTA